MPPRGAHRALALTNYEEVAGWAEMIEEVVREQRMPPWHADPKSRQVPQRSQPERRRQGDDLRLGQTASEGNSAELPEPIEYPEDWQLGEPDQVVYMNDKPYDVPAEGTVEYEYFMVDPGWTEDRWIKSTECRIGTRPIVHHIFVFAVSPENPLAQQSGPLGTGVQPGLGDERAPDRGAAPGTPPATGPAGAATLVRAGTKLLFQMHYTPTACATGPHGSRLSLCQAGRSDPKCRRANGDQPFVHHSGASGQSPVRSAHKFNKDALLINLTPHMHLRGKAFRYDLKYPNGSTETILNVPHYDFNWQVTYLLESPKFVPAGTELQCLAHFDNSSANLANPDPDSPVSWGDQTWEEMMIGWFTETDDVYPSDVSPDQTAPPGSRPVSSAIRQGSANRWPARRGRVEVAGDF